MVRFEVEGGVGRITLNRPSVSNAVDLPTAQAFGEAVTAAADDEDVRVILLAGAGPRFCGGGDVRSFLAASDPANYLHELATLFESQLRRMSELPKPVIAGVQGAVAGAGLAFVLNADVVVAARSTKFRMAYSGIGLTPDCGVSYLLPRAIGTQRALEFALTGRTLTAEDARAWGLVTEVTDDDAVTRRAGELAEALAAGPALALGQAKRLIRSSFGEGRAQSAADEARTIAAAVTTDEAQKLIRRFVAG
ncbi:2-(1,2-epoxy-1,2-dihydrophenyl)acetyl-CoA isomerase [Amycolatopsis bartoniae]|uniref:2-(1,2-epoxy-1,2-dihydrophenyl)acetyl-CoA isomerase n=1 Tax=Amycolatopsis bartoniae TaxID=941986 RepID=A0A8H9M353_9PSEU|nr:enoyl-CoA hydratase/isomerase family protein [Amycolatopsis bartoniae]MBB2939875.1 2-(1,2-epoxy-1,2-dihydrophenyl)acetyl-CoA isomerase [Amycolatopsis bartoniae]TVT08335.1 enoyl-CoA hydratase/isomerase family protein [Amycolatopsis bartoniae]GHF35952.1 2-(1,2-epoxy-1,2-dihydrophenyl)acetyl-CoA isomerase [Amycolatopsis bartoniae]